MSGNRTFVDSNIIIYVFSADARKKQIAMNLLSADLIISTQVVNENINICLKKLKLSQREAFAHGRKLLSTYKVASLYPSSIIDGMRLCAEYSFSFWDSLIVSVALENQCKYLLSEDMRTGLVVDKKLQIVNPFEESGFET